MNIDILIQAAEFLERRDREAEHGYASTLPEPENYSRRRRTISQGSHSSRKSQGNRSTHNELEKNRRAHLRHCLENLKYKVPVGSDSSRHTTLSLLTKAKLFIKSLEEKEYKQRTLKDQLYREQRFLRRRLEQLGKDTNNSDMYRLRVERSFSECSTSTHSTSNCSSESDEVDIVGYGSSDDSNLNDNSSDGGFTVSTRQLTLNDRL